MNLSEDDIYRTSTQYRLWSYSSASLASIRAETHANAAKRVVEAIQRHHDLSSASNESKDGSAEVASKVDCLTVDEAALLLTHYLRILLTWSSTKHNPKAFPFPSAVGATAVQYVRRFYLANSPMTYHPKAIIATALFLATKTEGGFASVGDFARKLRDDMGLSKMTEQEVLAPEFVLTQGLRFTFDVRHPFRGLRGGLLELGAMARGDSGGLILTTDTRSAAEMQSQMLALPLPSGDAYEGPKSIESASDLDRRVGAAFQRAEGLLQEAALLTDAYFLFTPGQIWMAAMLVADEPLTLFYLEAKMPTGQGDDAQARIKRRDRVVAVVRACADLLAAWDWRTTPQRRDELRRIDKKLYTCLNPDKKDLVGLHAAVKRGAGEAGGEADRAAKKRKMDDDEPFGGPLKAANGAADGTKD